MTSTQCVPYYVMRLDDDNDNNNNKSKCSSSSCYVAKALFSVPEELANSLIAYPILCRDSSFILTLDQSTITKTNLGLNSSTEKTNNNNNTVFLSATFESPYPEDAAREISRRLAIRIDHMDDFQVNNASDFLGF